MSRDGILVVGGGFLGRALAERLAASGHRVGVLSPRAEESAWPDGIAATSGRQEDRARVQRLLEAHGTVIHAAWGTTPGSSAGRPAVEAEAGLLPFLAFLDALQDFPDARLLFLSSGGTVYGDPARLPVAEEAPLQPRSCHGAGKAAAELFLRIRAPARTVVLRPSNIYGPAQALKSGFGVIPHLLRCAATGSPFRMWGDGSQVRDYLFVDDFCAAVLALAAQERVSGTFNLGSGAGTSLNDLCALVGAVTGRRLAVERLPAREADVGRIVLDIAALSRAVAWRPSLSLEAGLRRCWDRLRE